MQVILKSSGFLQSYRLLNIQNIVRINFKQWSFSVLWEKLNLANVKKIDVSACYVHSVWAARNQGFSSSRFCTPDHRPSGFVYIFFYVYSEKAVQGASRKKNRSNDFFSLSWLNDSLGILEKLCQVAAKVNMSFVFFFSQTV